MRVFICSPYSGNVSKNKAQARKLARLAFACGHTPLTTHLMYPDVLKHTPNERDDIIKAGLEWLDQCQAIWMLRYMNKPISLGMEEELKYNASHLQLPVFDFYPAMLRPWPKGAGIKYASHSTHLLAATKWYSGTIILTPRRDLWWWRA
jgi:hypothetical protein